MSRLQRSPRDPIGRCAVHLRNRGLAGPTLRDRPAQPAYPSGRRELQARRDNATVSSPLIDDLRAVVGAAHVLTGELAAGFERDWTDRFGGPAPRRRPARRPIRDRVRPVDLPARAGAGHPAGREHRAGRGIGPTICRNRVRRPGRHQHRPADRHRTPRSGQRTDRGAGRRHAGRPPGHTSRQRLALRGRPGGTRSGNDRGHDRDQRRRPARGRPRHDAPPDPGYRGGARRPAGSFGDSTVW